ncbi:MAG: enoyl-CoA hydratase/isomerase family protein [Chloroflexi bacterium]|nr:enoyl-CoA hydratase/isomerase family protein [Chloroflexota bacterium]
MAIIERYRFHFQKDSTDSISDPGQDMEHAIYEKRGQIARVTINMPEKRNPVNMATMLDFMACLRRAREDDEVRVVVVKGAGKDFGAGFDISSPPGDELAPIPPQLKPTVRDFFNVERRRCVKFEDVMYYPKFTIAQVQGRCIGASEALAASCDFTIAAEDAYFGRTAHGQLLWGIDHWPMWPHLSEKVRMNRLELEISGKEAEELGLVNKAVPQDRLDAEVERWAQALCQTPRKAALLGKEWFGSMIDLAGRSSTFRSHYLAHLGLQWVRFEPDEINMYKVRRDKGLRGFFQEREKHALSPLRRSESKERG